MSNMARSETSTSAFWEDVPKTNIFANFGRMSGTMMDCLHFVLTFFSKHISHKTCTHPCAQMEFRKELKMESMVLSLTTIKCLNQN